MRIIVETMTRQQAAASRRPELREMQCVIIGHPVTEPLCYWKEPYGSGTTPDIDRAILKPLSEILVILDSSKLNCIGLINEVEPEPGPDGKVRRRRAELVLGHSLFAMVQASPNNPQLRAHVMARCKIMPPDELDTAQKIVDWIECDLEMAGEVKPMATTPPPRNEVFVVNTSNSEVEKGTCRYSQTNTSKSAVPITRNLIACALEECPDDVEALVDYIAEHIEEASCEHEREQGPSDFETYDLECSETEHRNVEFSRRDLEAQLTTYLRNTLTREQLDELGL